MGESLFGKLRDVLSRETTSEIAIQDTVVSSGTNLARIGMATGNPTGTMMPQAGPPVSDPTQFATQPGLPASQVAIQPDLPASQVAPVGIQFFAELPTQESADEISSVSQRAKDCLSTESNPAGDGVWTVAVTLCMAPVPQEIHAIETVLQTWAQKMGGTSKGWGLSQNQAA